MPSLDSQSLLQPIPGESPEGDAAHFALTLAPSVRELRREESHDDFDDATRPPVLKKADWEEVARQCEDALQNKAKDLRTACLLTEARVRLEGLAGLASGFELVARLVDECWERVTPLEGDDPAESRGTPLANLLDDPDRGVCFPNLLRTLPLIGEEDELLSYNEWIRLRSERSEDEADQLGRVRDAIATETVKRQHDDAAAALASLDSLRTSLDERLGDAAPGLMNARAALSELVGLLSDELGRLGVASEPATLQETTGAGESASAAPLGDVGRDQLYTLLESTAERLRAMEPHSPIPYMIKRAVRLGRLPFPRLMQQVIREPSALTELNREFGIAEADGTEVLA